MNISDISIVSRDMYDNSLEYLKISEVKHSHFFYNKKIVFHYDGQFMEFKAEFTNLKAFKTFIKAENLERYSYK